MAKTLYNIGSQPAVRGTHAPAIFPGDGCEFTDQEAAELLAGEPGRWSESNPRVAPTTQTSRPDPARSNGEPQ